MHGCTYYVWSVSFFFLQFAFAPSPLWTSYPSPTACWANFNLSCVFMDAACKESCQCHIGRCSATLSGHLLESKKHLHFHSCWRTSTFSYYTTEFAVKYEPSFFGCRGTSGICCGVSEIRIASDKWESRSVLGQIVLFWNQDFEGFRH